MLHIWYKSHLFNVFEIYDLGPLEKRPREKIYQTGEDFIIDLEDNLLYHIEVMTVGIVSKFVLRQFFIPEELCNYIIQEYHDPMHLGMDQLDTKMRQKFWFPKMISKTEKYID